MTKITDDDVLKLAKLSNIILTIEEVAKFRAEIEEIVGYVEKLSAEDVAGLEPTTEVTGLSNVFRADEVSELTEPQELLKNAPAREGNLIKVKRVLG